MASSSSSTPRLPPPPPLYPSSSLPYFTVTQEQFNLFHNIDRILFSRLIRRLGRDPSQTMQVMGLWVWLEQTGQCRNLIDNMLRWPDTLLTLLADEAVLCLNCIESNEAPLSFENTDVPYTQTMTKGRVSLRFFRDNRFTVLLGVARNVNEICARAFEDILQLYTMEKNAASHDQRRSRSEENKQHLGGFGPALPGVLYHNIVVGGYSVPPYYDHHYPGFDVYDVAIRRQVMNNEIGDMMSRIQISDHDDHHQQDSDQVPSDERTIFLTFSKGYPISETEIRDFFSRIYGECIEAICMQEVEAGDQQPLYARLVVNSMSIIDVILDGKDKAKFSINGKHVWARKYVRKNNKSLPSSPLQ